MTKTEQYNQDLAERNQKILEAINSAYKELDEYADKKSDELEKLAHQQNEAPCPACGNSKFVLKYRDVNGKIHGETHGYFSLFGGSISGYIDGEINTRPVLSCRECGNERLIKIAETESLSEILSYNLPAIFPTLGSYGEATKWAKEKGLEVMRGLAQKSWVRNDYENPRNFSDKQYALCGLLNKYPMPKKPNIFERIFRL